MRRNCPRTQAPEVGVERPRVQIEVRAVGPQRVPDLLGEEGHVEAPITATRRPSPASVISSMLVPFVFDPGRRIATARDLVADYDSRF